MLHRGPVECSRPACGREEPRFSAGERCSGVAEAAGPASDGAERRTGVCQVRTRVRLSAERPVFPITPGTCRERDLGRGALFSRVLAEPRGAFQRGCSKAPASPVLPTVPRTSVSRRAHRRRPDSSSGCVQTPSLRGKPALTCRRWLLAAFSKHYPGKPICPTQSCVSIYPKNCLWERGGQPPGCGISRAEPGLTEGE